MKSRISLYVCRRNLYVLTAFLLSFSLISLPFVQITIASSGPERQAGNRGSNSRTPIATEQRYSANPNAPIPAPAPEPLAAVITATKVDALLNDDGDNKADPGTTEKIEYTITVSNTGTTDAANVVFSDTIDAHTTLVDGTLNTQPIADPDTYTASGNIAIAITAPGVLANDRDPDTGNNSGLTVTKVQGVGANVGVATDTTATGRGGVKGKVTLAADGGFSYEPPPGFVGDDTFTYETSDGTAVDTATVKITISNMVWFISNNAGGSNLGTFTNPFTTIASFNTANAATGATPDPKNGDIISLRTGTGSYNEADGINLRQDQRLIGNAVQFNTVFTADANSNSAYTTFAGAVGTAPLITASAGNGVDLSLSNHVRGLNVGNTSGFKINGGAVGTPIINTVNLTGSGGALNVATSGAFGSNVVFGTFESTSSVGANLNLVSVTGALGFTAFGTGLSGSAASSAAVNVSGGSVSFSYGGAVTKANAGPLVSISGGHNTGAITFTGSLSATAGTGLQFDNADSTYNFNGTTTLNGGDAGVDILNGSSGTFNFAASTSISNPTGPAFNVASSPGAPNVDYNGTITQNTANQSSVNINGTTGGTITFDGAVTGDSDHGGIDISNANSTITFTSPLTLGTSGARMTNQAVTIINGGSAGNYNLGAVSVFTNGVGGIVATDFDGTLSFTGVVNATAAAANTNAPAISIDGPVGLTTLAITLTSVSANNAQTGVLIRDTNGTFTVNGTGTTDGSGGVISNISNRGVHLQSALGITLKNMTFTNVGTTNGADPTNASSACGDIGSTGTNTACNAGIHAQSVTGLTLDNVDMNGGSQQGINGDSVTNFTLANSNVLNFGDQVRESGVKINNLFGTSSISNTTVSGNEERQIEVQNDSGTLTNLGITSVIVRGSTLPNGAQGILFSGSGTANMKLTVTNSTFGGPNPADHLRSTCIQTDVQGGSPTMEVTVTGSTFQEGGATLGAAAIDIIQAFSGNVKFDVSNNPTFLNLGSHVININQQTTSTVGSLLQGRINNNVIGNAISAQSGTVAGSGIRVRSLGQGTTIANITNNTVRGVTERGIFAELAEGTTVNNRLDTTISGNLVNLADAVNADRGILVHAGIASTLDDGVACADVLNNNAQSAGVTGDGIRVRQREKADLQMPGYTGGLTDGAAVITYLQGRNPATTDTFSASAIPAGDATAGFKNTPGPGNPCSQPSLPSVFVSSLITQPREQFAQKSSAADNSVAMNAAATVAPEATTSAQTSQSWLSTIAAKVVAFTNSVVSSIEPTAHASEAPATESFYRPEPVQKRSQSATLNSTQKAAAKTRSHHATLSPRALAAAAMAGETVNVNIGTLRAGDSVTIKFQVTVNNPPNLTLLNPPRVRNQGKVTADTLGEIFTDDPDVGGAADPTDTEVDLFNTTTSLVSDVNPSNFGDTVTFTATVAEDPTQPSADPTGTVDFIDTSDGNAVICNDVPLSGGSAQCQTSTLTSGTHNIRADYSGDGNFDPSQSNIVEQVINACSPDPIVTSTADGGAGSLREALADVCTGNTITFDLAGDGPHTITLTTGEIPVAKNVIIKNTSGESITVSGNNASRVFNINPSQTVSIVGLTISGGNSATAGGGILNDGTLTIVNSTLTGNNTSIDGGAISNSGPGILTLINTTISGNNATGNGGGVVNLGGTVTSINSTITNNFADSDANSTGTGGGIHHGSGTTTLHNTIVAGNFNEDGGTDAADDISGTVNSASSFNLIGTGGAGGLTNGANNNQVGVADAGLGPLANNGGTTQTHALSPTSAAVETGGNANLPADTFDLDGDADLLEALPVDQRGLGFPRNADSQDANTTQTVDIGAFELHPSIEDIANQSTDEDTVKNVPFNIGDDTGSLIASVTATSSNTTLVPNANLVITGSGGSRNLEITPAANQSGLTTITVTVTATNGRTAVDTFDLTVNAVNDAPVANDDSYSTDEDTPLMVDAANGVLANDTDTDTPLSSLTAILVNGPSNALSFTLNGDGSFNYTPNTNFNGPDTFTYKANDGSLDSNVATVTITVNAINDAPTLAINAGITVAEGSTNNTITSTMLRVDDVDNTAAQIVFTIGTAPVNGTLKKSGVALAGGGTFTQDDIDNNRITYDHDGSETTSDSFTFTVSDGAGGTIGLTTFNITITAQNDAPSITAGGTLNYTENDPATAIDTTITVTDVDSTNLASATITINVNYVNGQDVLSFTNTANISGGFNAATGTLTLTGSDTVANYEAALRTVKYNNTSDDPSTASRTVSWSVKDDGDLTSNVATSTINVTAVNDAPVNTVPGPQSTNQNTPLTFSAGNSNQISVADADAGSADIRVTLTVTNGTLTLATTAGLSFGDGDGTADTTMTFDGTLTEVNAAMNGMTFTPTAGFSGAATLTITSNDLGNTGTGGPLSDTDVVNIQVATNISIQDAQVTEPKKGSVNMIFTVTLSAPAPAGGASVNFTTQDQPAPCITCATAGEDYTATSGTLNFAAGEQFKTIPVEVLSDNKKSEANETFLVVLSNPVNATIADGTATGTIIENDQAGAVLISELRTSGPDGAGDDFVEIYNNSNSAITVNGTGGGYGLFKIGASCSASPVLLGVIPNGTVIPARGHFLFTGPAYSLANYGGTGAAAGDVSMSSEIESDRNVAIFSTASLSEISSANRLDAVGFGSNVGGICDLFREGDTLTPVVGSPLEYTYFRDECGKKGTPSTFGPCPTGGMTKDSNVNFDDFIFADTMATSTVAGHRLGAPGPQNLGSPRMTVDVLALLLDSSKGTAGSPNRVRDTTAIGPNAAEGTMSIRRRFQNNTGGNVTRLRIRVIDMSTAPTTGSTADLRVLSSGDVTVTVNDAGTCTAAGSATTPCTITVLGTTLETPPAHPLGGGLNSSVTTGTITLATPLAPGASVNLQFLLGVQSSGSFKFFFNIEALP